MGVTKKQKERERVPLPPNIGTQTSSCVSYKYNSLRFFVHRAPSFLFSLIIFFLFALLCFLYYGWFTLIYFFKFSFNKEVKESGSSGGTVEVCVNEKYVIEEVNVDYCTGNSTVPDDGEIQEKEIFEIEKMSEAHFEEKEDSRNCEGIVGVCLSQEVVTEDDAYSTGNSIESNDGEVEEKEITEIQMVAEARVEETEEEAVLDDEKSGDLLKLELQRNLFDETTSLVELVWLVGGAFPAKRVAMEVKGWIKDRFVLPDTTPIDVVFQEMAVRSFEEEDSTSFDDEPVKTANPANDPLDFLPDDAFDWHCSKKFLLELLKSAPSESVINFYSCLMEEKTKKMETQVPKKLLERTETGGLERVGDFQNFSQLARLSNARTTGSSLGSGRFPQEQLKQNSNGKSGCQGEMIH